jgi:uncharacterized membrane protein YfcA/rhodanese-related sulfurtransferase
LEIIGLIAAIFIGLSLGLIGGGGSILTVPILVYLVGVTPVDATAYSLFVVGLTALIGSLAYIRKDLVCFKTTLVFAIPSFISVFLTRKFILPAIPDTLFTVDSITVTKDVGIMLLFAALMLAASVTMIRTPGLKEGKKDLDHPLPLIIAEGFVVGIITGLVGAGGGFLIIPALVLFAGLPMKKAVGTSLLIIAAKSLIGFLGDVSEMNIDWTLLMTFSAFTIFGIGAGSYLSKFISEKKLKPAFGWFVLVMSLFITGKEFSNNIIDRRTDMSFLGSFLNNDIENLDSYSFEDKYNSDKNAVLLDTRTPAEHHEVRIPNSQLLNIVDPNFMNNLENLDRTKNYYLYCRSGNRSFQAARIMKNYGFENVYNLKSGIIRWHGETESSN